MITQAHARCAGAGRTNCSVGISEEGWKRIEEARQERDQITAVVFVAVAVSMVVTGLMAWWLCRREQS